MRERLAILILIMFSAGCSSKSKSTPCDPPCPTGYDCVDGVCVEPCDPPCGPGETCNVDTGLCEPSEDATTEPDVDAPADITDTLEEDDPVVDPVVDLTDPTEDEVEDPGEDVPADVPADTPCTGPSVLLTDTLIASGTDRMSYSCPTAHWTGSEFGVTWVNWERTGFLSRVSPAGAVLGAPACFADIVEVSSAPRSAWSGSNYGVFWSDYRGSFLSFSLTLPNGTKIGTDVSLNPGEPSISTASWETAWSGSEYGLVYDFDDGTGDCCALSFMRVSSTGTKLMTGVEISTRTDLPDHTPDIAWNGSEYGIAWSEPNMSGGKDMYFTRMSPVGVRIGGEIGVAGTAVWPHLPSLVWTGSEYGLAWGDNRDGNYEIYFVRLAGDGAAIGTDTRITNAAGDSDSPDLIWTGSEYVLAWSDDRDGSDEVYATFLSGSGVKTSSDMKISTGASLSNTPSLAFTGSAIGVFWKDGRAGYTDRYDLYHNQIGICP